MKSGLSRKKLWILGLVGYLCFFTALLPARLEGALLKSMPSSPRSTVSGPPIAGGDQDREFHDTMAEVGYVFLLIVVGVGLAGYAAAQTSK